MRSAWRCWQRWGSEDAAKNPPQLQLPPNIRQPRELLEHSTEDQGTGCECGVGEHARTEVIGLPGPAHDSAAAVHRVHENEGVEFLGGFPERTQRRGVEVDALRG